MSQVSIILIIVAAVIVLIVVSCTIVYIHQRGRRVPNLNAESAMYNHAEENVEQNQVLRLYDSVRRIKDLIGPDEFKRDDKRGIDVPFYDLKSILTATNNFSKANLLGEGGFGSVYKVMDIFCSRHSLNFMSSSFWLISQGKFPGGQEIAVKRLSHFSGQGIEEFMNEVVLISKLQHWNLIRHLGYCVEGDEKLVLYEYMPNKSLDRFIFDQKLCVVLNWELRFNIILGIARGLLYLHQGSTFKIIHRDIKTSNILLDEEWNPKISDFGFASVIGGKQTEANVVRVVGTYGYMSPEYAMNGVVSVKSDVFSFGVIVLEIISGKKSARLYNEEDSVISYAWRLWSEDKALDLMDQTLRETCNTNELLKCINVGLLCVQEDPNDRPTMSNVVLMLGRETTTLPTPKQPAFIFNVSSSSKSDSSVQ